MLRRTACAGALGALSILLVSPVITRARPETVEVQPGDALVTLAQRWNVSVDDLKRWNGLSDDRIQAGAQLRIVPAEDDAASSASPAGAYTVQAGDTLTAIAANHDLTVAQLVEFNPGLDPDRIVPGQELALGERRRMERHRVQPGQTLTAIARYHRVDVEDLVRWNPGLEPNRIRAGQTLTVFSKRPRSPSRSVGLPYAGQLQQATRLPHHQAWRIRDRDRAWATDETVRHLTSAFEALRQRQPSLPRVEVHDLSLREGGPMSDHASHQSGRDVDLAYFRRGCGQACDFRPVGPGQLDVTRQWALLSYWLKRGQVEAVFVDYRLQAALYREARRQGASRMELLEWFQYPRGADHPGGIIRHEGKHADHLHVRFGCHHSDPDCQPVRVVAEQARLRRASR